MRKLALADSQTEEIKQLANLLGGDPQSLEECIRALWRIVPDPDDCEYVRQPLRQFYVEFPSYKRFVGDCDDAATFAGALCKALGYDCEFIATRPAHSAEYTHVFLRVYSGGQAIDIDPVTPSEFLPLRSHAEEMHCPL